MEQMVDKNDFIKNTFIEYYYFFKWMYLFFRSCRTKEGIIYLVSETVSHVWGNSA
jgi:hypothetical protein